MGDPYAEGINRGVSNFATFYQLAQQQKLRRLQEQEIERKLEEDANQASAAQNLSNIIAMKGGKWIGKNPTATVMSPTGQVNMPPGIPGADSYGPVSVPDNTLETPSVPVDVEREPTPEDFEKSILEQKEQLARKNPTLFFKQGEDERRGAMNLVRRERMQVQNRRIKALSKRTEDRTKWDESGLGLTTGQLKLLQTKSSNARLIGDDDLADQYDAQIEVELDKIKNWMTGKNRGLEPLFGKGKGNKKQVMMPKEQSDVAKLRANPNNKGFTDEQLLEGLRQRGRQ